MRKYSSTIPAMTLNGSLSAGATSATITGANNLPVIASPNVLTLVIEPDTANEEIVTVTAHSSGSTSVTIVRGQESTSDITHASAVTVKHMVTARDLQEPHQHIVSKNYTENGSVELHGLGSADGDVVGSAKAQTLTNKTISGASNTISNIAQASVTNLTSDLAGKAASAHTHTLSNITDVTASAAELNTLDGVVATLTAAELNVLDGISTASSLATQLGNKLNEPATTGFVVRTGEDTVTTRSITTTSGISITNGSGVSGSPSIYLASATGTNFVTAANGWTITASEYKQSGNTVQAHIDFTRSGSSITISGDANISNSEIATINSTSLYPAIQAPAISGATGRIASGYVTPTGSINIAAVAPGANIATNDTFSFNIVYVL